MTSENDRQEIDKQEIDQNKKNLFQRISSNQKVKDFFRIDIYDILNAILNIQGAIGADIRPNQKKNKKNARRIVLEVLFVILIISLIIASCFLKL